MRYKQRNQYGLGQRRLTRVGTTPPLRTTRTAESLIGQFAGEDESIDYSNQGLLLAVKAWLKEHLEKVRYFLTRISLSKLQPGRTRWGPPWQWIEDEGPPISQRSYAKQDDVDRDMIDAHISKANGAPYERKDAHCRGHYRENRYDNSRRIGMRHARGSSGQLRSPRSEATRALCLLNRLRAHAPSGLEYEAINDKYGGREAAHRHQNVYGSSNVRIQRWVSCLPIGTTHDPGRQREYLSPPLTPIEEGG